MQTWTWVGIGVAAAVAYGCGGKNRDGKPDRPGNPEEHAKRCRERHPLFPRNNSNDQTNQIPGKGRQTSSGPKVAMLTQNIGDGSGDCPTGGCGLNGTWLGSGVPFRTLHLSPYRHNEVNLSVHGFRGPDHSELTLAVDGDVLHPVGKPIVEVGSVILLGPPETPDGKPGHPTYKLTITGVDTSQKFYVACPTCARQTLPLYQFTATSLDDDCELEVCKPGLDASSDTTHNLVGSAVIFRGDYYDSAYTVRTNPTTEYDDDTFNIACTGTAISKLHLLRHTSASQAAITEPLPPPVDKRQAILRMLTADYCGAGRPFTHDGVPLNFGFDLGAGYDGMLNPLGIADPSPDPNTGIALTVGSKFPLETGLPTSSIDALWNGNGATCIGTPRLLASDPSLMSKITAACREVNHRIVPCGEGAPTLAPPYSPRYPMTSYAISQIPVAP
jgi:ADYC domain